MNKTEKHRKIYPLPFEQISKLSSFEQILGRKKKEYTEDERKARWEKAMSFPGGKRVKDYYSNVYECVDCKHFSDGWCKRESLPCGVNPVVTFKTGYLGLACKGIGHEMVEGTQTEIEFEKSDLPF